MCYQPCVVALFGMNIGSNLDVEAQYFLVYGCLFHKACMRISCLSDNMRWDPKANDCSTRLLIGIDAQEYEVTTEDGLDAYCSKDILLIRIRLAVRMQILRVECL